MTGFAVPTVDLAAADAAAQLDRALRACGFVQLVGHPAQPRTAATLRARCDEFFALGDDVKRKYVHPSPEANRGFRAKGTEALSYSLGTPSPPDLFESFNCGEDGRVNGSSLFQPTPWPDEHVPGFADAAHAWLHQMTQLSTRIDGLLGSVLGFDLAARSTSGPDTMACIDYRPGADGAEPITDGQQRMGAHSDYTSFTLLHADPVPGLQIVGPGGEWVDVVPEPDALIMNVGDVLAMATNDVWASTLHRVIPMDAGCAPTRRSVAYFHYPDPDVIIEPLSFGLVDRPPRYRPVCVADHLLGKLTAPKLSEPATGASTSAGRL